MAKNQMAAAFRIEPTFAKMGFPMPDSEADA